MSSFTYIHLLTLIFSAGNGKKKKVNYDAEIQINKATMVQYLDKCLPVIWSLFLEEVFICLK